MSTALPLLILFTSLIPAGISFFLAQENYVLRNTLNLGGALAKLALVIVMLVSVAGGATYEVSFPLAPGLVILLRVDALALLFISLSAVLWLLTTVYAIAYFGTKPQLSRFFGFFSLCVAATTGLALSGSLISFFIFFELLTLSTWPLVAHKQDKPSLAAARVYLAYALPGSAALLWAIIWLESATGPVLFAEPPDLSGLDPTTLRMIFALFIIGVGVKAALVPLHGWLPAAMTAPAPVSALLHAVAVVKAGAFGVVRVVYDVFGAQNMVALNLGTPLALAASFTILYASMRALQQDEIKKRLAFSTVSQVSYIVLGAALASPLAMIGGLVHLIHQGLMKITLFFCAGIFDERAGVKRIDGLNGLGARMPWTAVSFSLGAMGMIGLPPLAGFVSKFYLGLGALEAGAPWVLGVLAASTILNAAYFLPMLYRLWFLPAAKEAHGDEHAPGLVVPAVITAAATIGVGLLAASPISPLGWATLIVTRQYGPTTEVPGPEPAGPETAGLEAARLEAAGPSGAHVSGARLPGPGLSGTDVAGPNRPDANLSGADLLAATPSGPDRPQAALSGAGVGWSDISDPQVTKADTPKTNLSRAAPSAADAAGGRP
ncbi:complex I subunit 5 family protein [Roseicitreum antarcticum]|uniref:Multicomponent Na+:H+ antiporter subunit D n=1 Tax=Roseicitreum antarcticum TaxID=564137 RepID=A0A1H3D812_9RHOB|nr:proton-conducting transporter membrane subunit [Roseicitreum antarcticum]SDX61894.1 multicomponent Na+:H+ antiporter subunit D [Roseicitreum antarcticum]